MIQCLLSLPAHRPKGPSLIPTASGGGPSESRGPSWCQTHPAMQPGAEWMLLLDSVTASCRAEVGWSPAPPGAEGGCSPPAEAGLAGMLGGLGPGNSGGVSGQELPGRPGASLHSVVMHGGEAAQSQSTPRELYL